MKLSSISLTSLLITLSIPVALAATLLLPTSAVAKSEAKIVRDLKCKNLESKGKYTYIDIKVNLAEASSWQPGKKFTLEQLLKRSRDGKKLLMMMSLNHHLFGCGEYPLNWYLKELANEDPVGYQKLVSEVSKNLGLEEVNVTWEVKKEGQETPPLWNLPTQPLSQHNSRATLPPINHDMTYGEARKIIMSNGWFKNSTHWATALADSYGSRPKDMWNRGFTEVQDCSGTGLAYCRFGFIDAFGNHLIIVTGGQARPGEKEPEDLSITSWRLLTKEEAQAKDEEEARREAEAVRYGY